MTPVCAVVLPPRRSSLDRTIVAGLRLVERAALSLRRGGIDLIIVSGDRLDDVTLAPRLARKGVDITVATGSGLDAVPPGYAAFLVSADVVFEPGVIGRMLHDAADDAVHARGATDALGGVLVYLPPAVLDALRAYASIHRGLFALYKSGVLVGVDVAPMFCRPVPPSGTVGRLERDYMRGRNGSEAPFTRAIRMFSVPASQALLRLSGRLPALLHAWAYGSVAALETLLAVKGSPVRRVTAAAIREPVSVARKEKQGCVSNAP